MSDELPFRAEYAKSSRASCKSCKTNIMKDSLRLAVMIQSPHFDGKQPNWFHYSCFWGKKKPRQVASHTDIAHFDSLRWEDQQKIKNKIKGIDSGETTNNDAGEEGASSATAEDFKVEYSKSSRAKCRECDDKITKGCVRISKLEASGFRGQPQDLWHHLDCFVEARDKLEFSFDADSLGGFAKLKSDDQQMLMEKLGKADGKRKKPKKEKEHIPTTPAVKVEEKVSEEEKKLEAQSKLLWEMRDKLNTLAKKHLSELLEYNGQGIPAGESRILDRLSDCMTFGALQTCPECATGQLVASGDGYHCTGNVSGWTKCIYMTKEPKRKPFVIPEEFKDISFLAGYKYVARKRVFPSDPAISHGKPLKGMKFVLVGKNLSKSKDQLKKAVEYLSGKVVTQVEPAVTCCISTKDDVANVVKKIEEAKAANVTIVSEGFVDDCKLNGDVVAAIKKYKICDWGPQAETLVKEEKPDAVQLKSTAMKAKKSSAEERMYTKSVPDTMKLQVKGGAAVDPDSGLQNRAHIVKHLGKPLAAVMQQVDSVKNVNSYYKLQVLKDDKKERYYVFRSWGRVGTTVGGNKLENMEKDEAIDHFLSLYEEKTGNMWNQKKPFVKHPNRFVPLEMDYGQDDEKVGIIKSDAGENSKLSKPLQELIKLIFDVEQLKKAMLEFEIDLKKMPLGKLSKKQIKSGYSVLTELQNLRKNGGTPTQFLDATNRFFTLIPHDFGLKKPPILDTEELIKAKTEMLDNLLEIEIAYNMLKSESTDQQKSVLDMYYEKLQCDMEVMNQETEECKRLIEYLTNTHAKTHGQYKMKVLDVFTTKRKGEEQRYKPFRELHNRQLLWHGSRSTNYAGILSQGLRIAPPEAPVTGYMFGKGVYFADMSSKSANYCCASGSNNIGLLLLCEVALGEMYEKKNAEMISKLPKGKHSTKGLGMTRPDPSGKYVTPDNTEIPMGKPQKSGVAGTSLLYNEYIVYDTAQINVKYLLKVKFDYGSSLW